MLHTRLYFTLTFTTPFHLSAIRELLGPPARLTEWKFLRAFKFARKLVPENFSPINSPIPLIAETRNKADVGGALLHVARHARTFDANGGTAIFLACIVTPCAFYSRGYVLITASVPFRCVTERLDRRQILKMARDVSSMSSLASDCTNSAADQLHFSVIS